MCLGLKITGHKNISVQEKFRLEQGPLKTGFTVYIYIYVCVCVCVCACLCVCM
jgi:hypothetical protein